MALFAFSDENKGHLTEKWEAKHGLHAHPRLIWCLEHKDEILYLHSSGPQNSVFKYRCESCYRCFKRCMFPSWNEIGQPKIHANLCTWCTTENGEGAQEDKFELGDHIHCNTDDVNCGKYEWNLVPFISDFSFGPSKSSPTPDLSPKSSVADLRQVGEKPDQYSLLSPWELSTGYTHLTCACDSGNTEVKGTNLFEFARQQKAKRIAANKEEKKQKKQKKKKESERVEKKLKKKKSEKVEKKRGLVRAPLETEKIAQTTTDGDLSDFHAPSASEWKLRVY